MRSLFCLFILLTPALTALADPTPNVTYTGGTITAPAAETIGALDLSLPDVLRFRSTVGSVDIP
jgi:hypothetical protein